MIVDSHMHVWSMKDVDYYNDKDIYTYMAENKIDKTAMIAISEKENAEMKKVVWPSRGKVKNNTITVLVYVLIVGAVICGLDVLFTWLMQLFITR